MSMFKKNTLVVIALILVAGVSYLLIEGRKADSATIKVGAVLPLTGLTNSTGQYVREGLELARETANKNGKRIEIVYEDSAGTAAQALSAYSKLTQVDKVNAIFVSGGTPTMAIVKPAESARIVVMAIGVAAPTLTAAGDYIFRHNLLPQDETKFLANYFDQREEGDIGIIVSNTESGISYLEQITEDLGQVSVGVKVVEKYEKGTTDYQTHLLKLKQSGVKTVLALSYPKELGLILKQAKELGLKFTWYTVYAGAEPEMIDMAGTAAEGVVFTHYYDQSSTAKDFREFLVLYKNRYGKEPVSAYTALAFDSFNLLLESIDGCTKSVTSECLKDNLYSIQDYIGATGPISFDANGDTRKNIVVKTIKNGQPVPLER